MGDQGTTFGDVTQKNYFRSGNMKVAVHAEPRHDDNKVLPPVEGVPLSRLVAYFLRLGTVGFGGPIALVGYMQRDLVEDRHWVSIEDYLEGLAFSQLSPRCDQS